MSSRDTWIDGLRLVAGISMMGLHASSDHMGQPFVDWEPVERIGPIALRTVLYMARTELFIMVSVFLLMAALDKRPRSYIQAISEQSRRLLVPLAFWVTFFAFYRLIKASYFGYEQQILAQLTDPMAWLGYFALGNVNYHMHFIPTLFPILLMYPLYRIAVKYPALGALIILALLIKREVDQNLWAHYRDIAGFEYIIRAVKVSTYLGYGLIAASFYGLLSGGRWQRNDRLIAACALSVAAALVVIKIIHSSMMVKAGDWQFNYTPGYWADFLMPALLFALAACARNLSWPRAFSVLAPFSFGLYLVHPAFLDLAEIATHQSGLSPIWLMTSKIAFILPATALAVWLISKSRPIAWTIGLGPLPKLRAISSKTEQFRKAASTAKQT